MSWDAYTEGDFSTHHKPRDKLSHTFCNSVVYVNQAEPVSPFNCETRQVYAYTHPQREAVHATGTTQKVMALVLY